MGEKGKVDEKGESRRDKESEEDKGKNGKIRDNIKYPGKEIPDTSDELLIQIANSQLRADYRKSLGKEHARRSWDLEIKKSIKSTKKKSGERDLD